jgi:cytochrome subunit of sulfide dehydrogenase
MKNKSLKANSIVALTLFSLFLFSCKDDVMSEDKTENANAGSELMTKSAALDLPGRVLASNCFQCHGTNGYAGELKIGEQSASSIISDINEMKTKDPRSNIMNVHARAYTTEEIKLIANYISQQVKY